jgi:hypothetical protein
VSLTGCTAVYSVHPLYTSEDESIVEAPLEGTWVGHDDEKVEFSFQKVEDNKYKMVISGPDSKIIQVYEVHLVQLRDQLFMDLVLKNEAVCQTDVGDQLGVVSHHVIAKVEISQDDLAFSSMDADLILKQNIGEYLPLEHVDTDGLLLITSPTESLRKYVSDYAGTVFSEDEHLARKPETAQPASPPSSPPVCPKE